MLSSADVVEGDTDFEDLWEPIVVVAILGCCTQYVEATYLPVVVLMLREGEALVFGVDLQQALLILLVGLEPGLGAFVDGKQEAVLLVSARHAGQTSIGKEDICLTRHQRLEEIAVIEQLPLSRPRASCGGGDSDMFHYSLAVVCLLTGEEEGEGVWLQSGEN